MSAELFRIERPEPGENLKTIKEIAGAFNVSNQTARRVANKLFPNKTVEGIKAFYTESECSLIYEEMLKRPIVATQFQKTEPLQDVTGSRSSLERNPNGRPKGSTNEKKVVRMIIEAYELGKKQGGGSK